jgi:hypothetical protein
MAETGYGRAIDRKIPQTHVGRKDGVQSQMMASDPRDINPDADTMMELLERQYPWAFKVIQEAPNDGSKLYGMTVKERLSLEMSIQKHSYPFTWVSVRHGTKEFSNIDHVGRYFTETYYIGRELSSNPKLFDQIPDSRWKF